MTVYLVGAGPGDPGLLTRRGAELLARAEVVVHDRLVDPAVLALAAPDARLVDVGKRPAGQDGGQVAPGAARQGEINELLVEFGRHHSVVVRLKGGDPFVFGRGGEEAEALSAAGVPWEVVPGVTSALAVPAVAGIPVTHRGLSTSVTVVTGHVGDPTAPGGVDWEALARAGGTVVVLMGMATRRAIADRLLAAGRPADTPVAVVEWGTTAAQRTRHTTLAELHGVDLGSPAVVVIGPVAGLALGGRGPAGGRPLAGRTVVVTRIAAGAGPLTEALRAAGARVVGLPMEEVADPADGGAALAAATTAENLGRYDWVAFTSATAVARFCDRLRDGRDLGRARLAAVGEATAAALGEHHLAADLVPAATGHPASAAGLAAAFPEAPATGGRVLFPRAEAAGPDLVVGLAGRGWVVDEVEAYRTVPAPAPEGHQLAAVANADALTFASGRAARAWLALRDADGRPLPVPPVVACLGPVTAAAARQAGLEVTVTAAEPSADALVEALVGILGRAG